MGHHIKLNRRISLASRSAQKLDWSVLRGALDEFDFFMANVACASALPPGYEDDVDQARATLQTVARENVGVAIAVADDKSTPSTSRKAAWSTAHRGQRVYFRRAVGSAPSHG